jgi:hypothetical protein
MKLTKSSFATLAATTLVAVGTTFAALPTAAADPDYSALPIHPNDVTDSTAYVLAPVTLIPNGQPGVEAIYTHRDSTRQIKNTILVLPDPAAATAALSQAQGNVANLMANEKTQPVQVGTGGTLLSGTSPDGSKSMSVLLFTEGNTATTVEFDGPANDPVPTDMAVEFGQRQDRAIVNALGV